MNRINILGTEYVLNINTTDYLRANNADGVHLEYDKEINLRCMNGMLSEDSSERAKFERQKEVLRHEIIHAFFSESGLGGYNVDEQLVDWIAKQFPKIKRCFEEAEQALRGGVQE